MMNRTTSLLSSLAVAILALAFTASLFRATPIEVDHAPTPVLTTVPDCWTPPQPRLPNQRECIA